MFVILFYFFLSSTHTLTTTQQLVAMHSSQPKCPTMIINHYQEHLMLCSTSMAARNSFAISFLVHLFFFFPDRVAPCSNSSSSWLHLKPHWCSFHKGTKRKNHAWLLICIQQGDWSLLSTFDSKLVNNFGLDKCSVSVGFFFGSSRKSQPAHWHYYTIKLRQKQRKHTPLSQHDPTPTCYNMLQLKSWVI